MALQQRDSGFCQGIYLLRHSFEFLSLGPWIHGKETHMALDGLNEWVWHARSHHWWLVCLIKLTWSCAGRVACSILIDCLIIGRSWSYQGKMLLEGTLHRLGSNSGIALQNNWVYVSIRYLNILARE